VRQRICKRDDSSGETRYRASAASKGERSGAEIGEFAESAISGRSWTIQVSGDDARLSFTSLSARDLYLARSDKAERVIAAKSPNGFHKDRLAGLEAQQASAESRELPVG